MGNVHPPSGGSRSRIHHTLGPRGCELPPVEPSKTPSQRSDPPRPDFLKAWEPKVAKQQPEGSNTGL